MIYPSTDQGYSAVYAKFPDKEICTVYVDTGSTVTLTDRALTQNLSLKPQYTRRTRINGIKDNISTSQYVAFTIKIDDKKIYLQAYILPVLKAEILVKIDTLRHYEMDVLVSKNVLKWEDVKVPLITKKITTLVNKYER